MAGINPSVLEWTNTQGATPLATTALTAIKAAVANKVHCLSSAQIQNGSATVSTVVNIVDDTATVIWSALFPAIPASLANQPLSIEFNPPLKSSPGKALSIQCVTTAAAIYWNAQGFDV